MPALEKFDRLPKPAQKALAGDLFPKFAATRSNEGIPNVVPLLTTSLADETTLIFVRFMIWKTAQNLEANRRITIAVIGPGLGSWIIRGEFDGFVRQGPYLDHFDRKSLFRYNAYAGAGEVGVIRVKETRGPLPLRLLSTVFYSALREPSRADEHGSNSRAVMPPTVLDKFDRRLALKFLGWVEPDGSPLAVPCLDLHPRNPNVLAFALPRDPGHPLRQIQPGMKVAASVLTPAPVAYQVKGVYAGEEKIRGLKQGILELEESYTAAPPVPGRRIFPPEIQP